MALRAVVGFFLVVCLILLLYIAPPFVLPIVLAVMSVLAVQEILMSTHFITQKRIIFCAGLFAAAVPIWVYRGEDAAWFLLMLFLLAFALFFIGMSDHKNITFEKISAVFFASFFIPYFLSSIVRILLMDYGRFLVAIPFVAAFIADLFAYLSGLAFGKHKLAPAISPKKTVEGLIGGLIGAVALTAVYGAIINAFYAVSVSIPLLLMFGLIGGVVSTFGDLFFSYVKREFGLKDFGNILPGHGGILDRFDSLLFAAPAIELLLFVFPHVIS